MNRFIRNKYIIYFYFILPAIFIISGCHLVKKTVNVNSRIPEEESLVRKVVNAQPEWKFLEIRMTGKAEEERNRINFIGSFRMEKGKRLFIMVRSSIGIELGHVFADMDSVWVVSKMLNIKEKGDWKMIRKKVGYPLDFNVLQNILVQSLFTSSGDQVTDLIDNLVVRNNQDSLHLISKGEVNHSGYGLNYYNDFLISRATFAIESVNLRDLSGQWIADVKYFYNKDNQIKKISFGGIDSEHNFKAEINIVKREIKDFIEINFDKF